MSEPRAADMPIPAGPDGQLIEISVTKDGGDFLAGFVDIGLTLAGEHGPDELRRTVYRLLLVCQEHCPDLKLTAPKKRRKVAG